VAVSATDANGAFQIGSSATIRWAEAGSFGFNIRVNGAVVYTHTATPMSQGFWVTPAISVNPTDIIRVEALENYGSFLLHLTFLLAPPVGR
jgi:hypothetical protein